jgi:hypothetical protein
VLSAKRTALGVLTRAVRRPQKLPADRKLLLPGIVRKRSGSGGSGLVAIIPQLVRNAAVGGMVSPSAQGWPSMDGCHDKSESITEMFDKPWPVSPSSKVQRKSTQDSFRGRDGFLGVMLPWARAPVRPIGTSLQMPYWPQHFQIRILVPGERATGAARARRARSPACCAATAEVVSGSSLDAKRRSWC